MGYEVERVVVIGAGTMGAGIAAHAAGAGLPVHLLDVLPRERVAAAVERLGRKTRQPAFSTPGAAGLITVGNLDEDFARVGEGDLVVEAIVEQLGPKRELMARVERVRKASSIVTTNTSGLPIREIASGAGADFRAHFLGTHFFNPPYLMPLLEVIPGPETSPEVLRFMTDFAARSLRKSVVVCKDTPNFIANRLASVGGAIALSYVLANGYTVEEADAVLGPVIGRPRTTLFRLQDLVGLDVSSAVAENLYGLIPEDETREVLRDPRVSRLRDAQLARGRLGDKTGQGFYRKPAPGEAGEILSLDLETLEYRPRVEPAIPSVEKALLIESLPARLSYVLAQDDRAGRLARHVVYNTLAYAARRIPEITDHLVNVDRAMRWGYAHELGPFELWDALGVGRTAEAMESEGVAVAPWVRGMLAAGHETFYRTSDDGRAVFYDPARGAYVAEETS